MQNVSFFNGSEVDAERKRRLAASLLERSKPTPTEMVGGMAVPQSPLEHLAKALSMGVSGYYEGEADREEKSRKEQARQTMASALEAFGRSQEGGQSTLSNGETVNWNKSSPDASGSMLANILMSNEDTAPIGMQTQLGQVQAKQQAAQELQSFQDLMPLKLQLAEKQAQIEAKYRAPSDFDLYRNMTPEEKNDYLTFKGKSPGQIDPATGEVIPTRKLSAAEQKEVFDIQEKTDATTGAISALERAKEILTRDKNSPEPQPYTGMGADFRTGVARVPLVGELLADKGRAAATTEAKNLVTEQALGSMKAIFGSNPTEGERTILLQLQALPTFTPEEQSVIIDNAIKAAQRRESNLTQRLQQIETGNYFEPIKPPPSGPATPPVLDDPLGIR